MIPVLNPSEVRNLPFSTKEKLHRSRNRKGYCVFLSWYFGEFKGLDNDVKLHITSLFITNGDVNGDSSVDSILTLPGSKIHVSVVMKEAASHWKHSIKDYHTAWSALANQLDL